MKHDLVHACVCVCVCVFVHVVYVFVCVCLSVCVCVFVFKVSCNTVSIGPTSTTVMFMEDQFASVVGSISGGIAAFIALVLAIIFAFMVYLRKKHRGKFTLDHSVILRNQAAV